jgi:hypothetical protein
MSESSKSVPNRATLPILEVGRQSAVAGRLDAQFVMKQG